MIACNSPWAGVKSLFLEWWYFLLRDPKGLRRCMQRHLVLLVNRDARRFPAPASVFSSWRSTSAEVRRLRFTTFPSESITKKKNHAGEAR